MACQEQGHKQNYVGQRQQSQSWREIKSSCADCGSGSDPKTLPGKYCHGEPWTAMASGHLPKQGHLGRTVWVVHFCSEHQQGCLSSKLQVSHISWSQEKPCVPDGWSMAVGQVSLYCLYTADVPLVIMDFRQIRFLYGAGAINSPQYCPPISPKCIPVVLHQHDWHRPYWEHELADSKRSNCILRGSMWGWLLCFRTGGSWSEKLSRLH